MSDKTNASVTPGLSRRDFLKTSLSGAAVAGLAGPLDIARSAHAASSDEIQIALVGCGGRGTGAAANALSTQGPVKLVAMADVFETRLQGSLKSLQTKFPKQVDVPQDRQFIGMDGYKKAIDLLGKSDLVLLTTPPAFRPIHVEYAVAKGVNVFMEKSFAVDAPGIRRVLKAGEEASRKNLKIAGGLMSRHSPTLAEAIGKIHEGAIGDIITLWSYREHGPVGQHKREPGMNELAYQIRNYSCFTWLNGTFLLDWLIHNLDICCWIKNDWPVSAQGQGGRQCRLEPDQLFDHYAVEYSFPDGTRMFGQGRHQAGSWSFWGNVVHGTKGSAILGEGQPQPRIYKGHNQKPENLVWQHEGVSPNPYQVEHDELFAAIRQDKPYNEAERCAKAAMVGILGRMACESGKLVTWDEAMASNLELAPGLDNFTMTSPAPVAPDAEGRYPVAMPGKTVAL